jgi:hypothetical protein
MLSHAAVPAMLPAATAGGGAALAADAGAAPSTSAGALASLSQAMQQLVSAVDMLRTAMQSHVGGQSAAGTLAGGAAPSLATSGAATLTPPLQSPAPAGADGAPKADEAKAESGSKAKPKASAKGKYKLGSLAPNQYRDTTNKLDGKSACGPAAAVAFARFLGKDPSLDSIVDKARSVGWTRRGMAGPASEAKLLRNMGIKSHLENKVDWDKVKKTVLSGKPVIVSTPGHYWVAEGYDAKTGKFDFGETGKIFKGGKRWFSPDEMKGPGKGAARATIYLDE